MKYLLDTSVISESTKPRPSANVLSWIDAQDEFSLFLSVITLGELQKGINKLPNSKKRLQLQAWVMKDLTNRFSGRILHVDQDVAMRWGALAGTAERQGQKIPVLDGLLAATALVGGLTLVTRNSPHMQPMAVAFVDPWML